MARLVIILEAVGAVAPLLVIWLGRHVRPGTSFVLLGGVGGLVGALPIGLLCTDCYMAWHRGPQGQSLFFMESVSLGVAYGILMGTALAGVWDRRRRRSGDPHSGGGLTR